MTARELIRELEDLARLDPTVLDWEIKMNARDNIHQVSKVDGRLLVLS